MDSSISDSETTIDLDDSEWIPAGKDNDSDEEIEIVGEVGKSSYRSTRSTRSSTARTATCSKISSSTPNTSRHIKSRINSRSLASKRSLNNSLNKGRKFTRKDRSSGSAFNISSTDEQKFSSPKNVSARTNDSHTPTQCNNQQELHELQLRELELQHERQLMQLKQKQLEEMKRKKQQEELKMKLQQPEPDEKQQEMELKRKRDPEESKYELDTSSSPKRRIASSRISRKNPSPFAVRGRGGFCGPALGGALNEKIIAGLERRAHFNLMKKENKEKMVNASPQTRAANQEASSKDEKLNVRILCSVETSDIFVELPDIDVPVSMKPIDVKPRPDLQEKEIHSNHCEKTTDQATAKPEPREEDLFNFEDNELDVPTPKTETNIALTNKPLKPDVQCNLAPKTSPTSNQQTNNETTLKRSKPEYITLAKSSSHPPVINNKTEELQDDSIMNITLKSEHDDLNASSNSEFTPIKKPILKKKLSTSKKVKTSPVKQTVSKVTTAKKSMKVRVIDPDIEVLFEWDPANVISHRQGVAEWQARKVISLFDEECTLPFIARYRRDQIGNMDLDKLREVQNAYQQLKEVKQKVSKLIQDSPKELTAETKICLLNATSVQEVKALTASLKKTAKKTLAERARQLGLGESAETLLNDFNCAPHPGWAMDLIDPKTEGRKNLAEVETAIKHIIADIISKDLKMLSFMKSGLKQSNVQLESTQARRVKSQEKAAAKPKKVIAKRKSMGGKEPVTKKKIAAAAAIAPNVIAKYNNYFNFSSCAWSIKSHIVCALNRGEQQGVLSVKVTVPSVAYAHYTRYCADHWLGGLATDSRGFVVPYRRKLLLDMLPDCWDRLVLPSLQSYVRSELNDAAELASIEVFAANLRRLLLTPPVRANTVLAIDPGFLNGCKVAVVERKGKVLAVDTIYPSRHPNEAALKLRQMVIEYRCEIVCIGNGTACRETESWLTMLVKQGAFEDVNVQYTIINESGASQYSITPEAKQEFPDMDINHISAVSLARRLQDPLLEYVKVPAMHLGVGMYQHDVATKLLTTSLDAVVMECVSFVGVDLNVASEFVLRKVSGLSKSKATAIVKHREANGPFRSREELKSVKGIGPVSFQQCAGFVRIVPQTVRQKSSNSNLSTLCTLDSTTVHPESYTSAMKMISFAKLKLDGIGSSSFITALRIFIGQQSLEELSSKCDCSEATLKVVLESLYQPLDYDFRAQFDKPLFRKGVTSINDLKSGELLTGTVRNVVPFGAFVDIGVGDNGLIHSSKMNGHVLQLGDTVIVQVMNFDVALKRIPLWLKEVVG